MMVYIEFIDWEEKQLQPDGRGPRNRSARPLINCNQEGETPTQPDEGKPYRYLSAPPTRKHYTRDLFLSPLKINRAKVNGRHTKQLSNAASLNLPKKDGGTKEVDLCGHPYYPCL